MAGPISTAIGDIFGAIGAAEEATAYDQAASYATQSAQIEKESTAIQQTQLSRVIYQTLGAQRADQAAGGFTSGGSAGDVYRSSVSQGSLAHQLVAQQGAINRNSYLAAASQYKGMASNARAQATGQAISSPFALFGL